MLPSRLWDVARMEQEKRQEADPWEDALACIKGEVCPAADAASPDGQEERIATQQLLCGFLHLEIGRTTDRDAKRLSYCMRRLGWLGPKPLRIGGKPTKDMPTSYALSS